jgi:hypothetical protein
MTIPDRACPDCAVSVGTAHEDGCDVARCLATGRQRLMCDGFPGVALNDARAGEPVSIQLHDCGREIWTGRWPGEVECEEYGWWCYFVPHQGFIPCGPDHPEAMHDLNRLALVCDWDAAAGRWRRREEVAR